MKLPRGPLRSRNFRLLLACDVVSMAGTAVGYVATAGLLPMIAFLLLGGVIADRLPRHQVIVAADLLQGAAQGVSAALVLTGAARPWELAACAVLRGTGLGFYYPAATGL